MYKIKHILVTTDFSDFSATAIDYAISLADVHCAKLSLLHVVEDHSKALKNGVAVARRNMQQFVYEKFDEFTWVTQAVKTGQPYKEIVLYAKDHHADLIVIATHGRTGLAHIIMGSVAEKVIRNSPVPVIVVKPSVIAERLVSVENIEHKLHII